MRSKRELGQYYTQENPFNHPLFKEWMVLTGYRDGDVILEPFSGANNILKLMDDSGFHCVWKCYDIDPSMDNVFPKYQVEYRDTIENFPTGYKICITNCPYLGKSSARRRKIHYPWKEDDLYKVCLNRMLGNCEYVTAIIPESFITANIHKDRLWGVVSLTCKMFSDTECPVCLAMFVPQQSTETRIYANDTYLGTMEELSAVDLTVDTKYHEWVFNDKNGSIGVKTVDNQKTNDCRFFDGNLIDPESIKVSSRSFTRISGLPENIDKDEFFSVCNQILEDYRTTTKDILMTSFKGLRSDGKYRRRLDFRTVRCIMNRALKKITEKISRNQIKTNMAKGRKFIRKIKALKTIKGVVQADVTYETEALKEMFPYIDFKNGEYFEEVFDNKFKVGDEVYVSAELNLTYSYMSHNATYVINGIHNQVIDDCLYTQYDIYDKADKTHETFTLDENYILAERTKYIVSLNSYVTYDHPSVHAIPERIATKKYDEMWTKYMIFDTRTEAEAFASRMKEFLQTNGNR